MTKKIIFLCLFPILSFSMDTPLPPSQKTITNLLLSNPNILGQRIQNSKLNLSGLGLTNLKGLQEIPGIESITYLDLSSNRLTAIPANSFAYLPKLKELFLNNNQINKIEWHAFNNLTNLEELILDNNKLTTIGGQFIERDLSSLKKLGLAHNEILKIHPQAFKDLINLNIFDLSNNYLAYLDYKLIEPLSQLRYLDVTGNKYLKLIPTYKQFILKKMAPGAELES